MSALIFQFVVNTVNKTIIFIIQNWNNRVRSVFIIKERQIHQIKILCKSDG